MSIPLCSKLLNLFTSKGRTCEGDLVDIHVTRERRTHFAIAGNDVDNAWWEASFLDELTKLQHSDWTLFRALVYEGTTSSQSSSTFEGEEDG
jgi:hypothetical protein